jgi:hypothetical protein
MMHVMLQGGGNGNRNYDSWGGYRYNNYYWCARLPSHSSWAGFVTCQGQSSHLHAYARWRGGYWSGYCYGCGYFYVYTLGGGTPQSQCPSCQYYNSTYNICVNTPACFGGSCPNCQYLDPGCQVMSALCTWPVHVWVSALILTKVLCAGCSAASLCRIAAASDASSIMGPAWACLAAAGPAPSKGGAWVA